MKLKIDDRRADNPDAEGSGQGGRFFGQRQVFPVIPDTPFGPVPGMADLEVGDLSAQPAEHQFEKGSPGIGRKDILSSLQEGGHNLDALLPAGPNGFFKEGESFFLPGRDPDQGLLDAQICKIGQQLCFSLGKRGEG